MEALIGLRVAEIAERYTALSSLVPLGTIRTEDEYDRAVAVLNALLDSGAAERNHPLAGLVETLGLIIGDYDERHFPNAPRPAARSKQVRTRAEAPDGSQMAGGFSQSVRDIELLPLRG